MAHGESIALNGRIRQEDAQNLSAMIQADNHALAVQCQHRLNISLEEYLNRTKGRLEMWLTPEQAKAMNAIDMVIK